jgi:hypothetical protein
MDASMSADTSKRAFVRHFFEMLVAMAAGMALLGAAVSVLLSLLGCASLLEEHADLHAVVMATNMSVGMALWMRHRGHTWTHIGQMAGAMYVPFLLLVVPYWAGLLGSRAFLGGGHVLMLPAMLGVMLLRWEVYAHNHWQHVVGQTAELPTT